MCVCVTGGQRRGRGTGSKRGVAGGGHGVLISRKASARDMVPCGGPSSYLKLCSKN